MARRNVDTAKRGLGERGPVWWTDGALHNIRYKVARTPYAEWYRTVYAIRDHSRVEERQSR